MDFSILVVDDKTDVRRSLKLCLVARGYKKVYLATSGKDAITKQKKHSYSLILLDMHMPPLDGPEVTRKIREFDQDVQFILITGYNFEKDYKPHLKEIDYINWHSKTLNNPDSLISDIEKAKKIIQDKQQDKEKDGIVLLSQTLEILRLYPRIEQLFRRIFLKEIPELKGLIEDLGIMNIDDVADSYKIRLKKVSYTINKIYTSLENGEKK